MDAGWPWRYQGMNRSLFPGRSAVESTQYSHSHATLGIKAACMYKKLMFQVASV